jgi:N-acetyl-anhydromuramyl-L-alanine amidase AmpD
MAAIKRIVVHHTAGNTRETLESVRRYHTEIRGFSDIGYHYLVEVKPSLRLRIGRRADKTGAHARGKNTGSIGVCIVGSYENAGALPPASREYLARILADLCLSYGLSADDVFGHWEVMAEGHTQCPGFDPDVLRGRVSFLLGD